MHNVFVIKPLYDKPPTPISAFFGGRAYKKLDFIGDMSPYIITPPPTLSPFNGQKSTVLFDVLPYVFEVLGTLQFLHQSPQHQQQ